MTAPSFWLRCKRRLVKFQPAFLPMADYIEFKRRPLLKSNTSLEPVGWWSSRFEYRTVTENPAYNRRRARRLLRDDTALRKLLGDKEHIVEIMVRENQLMIAVFDSHDHMNGGRVFAYNSKAERQGNFRFVWTNQFELGKFDFHVVSPHNNPLVDPHDPLFIYSPVHTAE